MKDIIEKIKDYLPIIALIPLLIGGFWQLIELALISSSYIRFFSVTQQLADGLLILFISALLYLTYLFIKKGILSDSAFNVAVFETSTNKQIFFKLLLSIFVFAVSAYFMKELIYIIPPIIESISNGIINIGIIIFSLIVTAFAITLSQPLFVIVWVIIKRITKIEINISSDTLTSLRGFGLSIAFIIFLRLLFTTIYPAIHSTYIVPKNLTNLQYVIDKYSKENKIKDKKSLEIIYLNDKYIFIQHGVNIEVVKSDYMFKSDK